MSIATRLSRRGASGFGPSATAEAVTTNLDLTGRNIVVTGATSGIGQETARVLALRGAKVVALGRSPERIEAALHGLPGDFERGVCDLSDLASVDSCIAALRGSRTPIDGIVANAGTMASPELKLCHGIEQQYFVNYVAHFHLITSLLDQLTSTARVVAVSSTMHNFTPKEGIDFDNLGGERHYHPWRSYGRSKLALLLFSRELARRFAGTQRTANAVHPGVIRTGIVRNLPSIMDRLFGMVTPLVFKTVAEGAATQSYVAAHPDAATLSGEYFVDTNPAKTTKLARDEELGLRLWTHTEAMLRRLTAE